MTLAEKILASKSGRRSVSPGEIVVASVDRIMIHDVSGVGVFKVIESYRARKGIDSLKLAMASKTWVAEDHFVPPSDRKSASNIRFLESMASKYGIERYYRYGAGENYGISHTLALEEGLVRPGDLYIGGDSHTNTAGVFGALAVGMGHTDVAYALMHGVTWLRVPETIKIHLEGSFKPSVMAKDLILRILGDIGSGGADYRVMEFRGPALKGMNIDERATLTNMTTEASAKSGIMEPDDLVLSYLEEKTGSRPRPIASDPDAWYVDEHQYRLEEIEPMVAKPSSPDNVSPVSEVEGVEVDRVYVGSCIGAKLTDLRAVARILKGRRVKVRTEILPASHRIYRQALKEGLIDIFTESGALIGPPTCGACFGGHMGVVADGETVVSTTNRNYPGRMGSKEARVYLASPLTAAASAVTGRITDPGELM